MRKFSILKLVLFSSFFNAACMASDAQAEQTLQNSRSLDRPNIAVQGYAVKEASPDIVEWSLLLRSEGKETNTLASVHAKKLQNLLSYLKKEGIESEKIQTQQMQFSENWNYENGKRFKQGYFASSSVNFESHMKSYSTLWKGLAGLESVSVNGSHFSIVNKLSLQKEARVLALMAAKEKAVLMAGALDMKVGKPLVIEDQTYTVDARHPQMEMMRSAKFEDSSPIVAPGKIDVSAQVGVVFEIE
jgi:uncharacterized protein YggE